MPESPALKNALVSAAAKQRLPFQFAKKHGVLFFTTETENVISAQLICREHVDQAIVQEIYRVFQANFSIAALEPIEFDAFLQRIYAEGQVDTEQLAKRADEEVDLAQLVAAIPTTDLLDDSDDAPVVQLLNGLFTQAIQRRASDIHIESFSDGMQIRFRIDGILQTVLTPQLRLAPLICSRIKVLAKLDIAEKRLPQDGRLTISLGGHKIDVRVSTLPTNNGERIVLRVLDQKQAQLDLPSLGLTAQNSKLLQSIMQKPHGIILVTGPTGSGKTTTLYAILQALHDNTRNIMTIEDPIEYDLKGVSQSAVNLKTQMTFARGLRSILRQDPDIVMVGEIRDGETAKIAVQASMTGHLVLSTLHTNTAVSAVTRLRDMGVETFLLSSTLLGVIAERLVRKLCRVCKQAVKPTATECTLLNITEQTLIFAPQGCEACHHSGYSGRLGIYEIFVIDETSMRLIHTGADEKTLIEHARKRFPSILADGLARVINGDTSLAEVLRVLGEDSECF